jgi:histidinol-phosphate/aromatic aminotransferase/cobyric acid decarboxylase-like protein
MRFAWPLRVPFPSCRFLGSANGTSRLAGQSAFDQYWSMSPAELDDLFERHRTLDDSILRDRQHFPSDWNATHPFASEFLGSGIASSGLVRPGESRYVYFDEQYEIVDAIRGLHRALEGIDLSRESVLAGPGSSSFLLALCLWLVQQGYTEIYYIPPLYYTFHYFLKLFRIRARPLPSGPVFESTIPSGLPAARSLLALCDPAWFAGYRVPPETIDAVTRWQQTSGSLVIVDGSFQFMQWDRTRREYSSLLDPELTFRLISPGKSLAIPFFRFAYLLHPARMHRDLVFLYENMVGASTVADLAFAGRALQVLSSETCNFALTDYLKSKFGQLVADGILSTRIMPNCGNFVFAAPAVPLPGQIAMDQEYFEVKGYAGHIRINLMLADRVCPVTPTNGSEV